QELFGFSSVPHRNPHEPPPARHADFSIRRKNRRLIVATVLRPRATLATVSCEVTAVPDASDPGVRSFPVPHVLRPGEVVETHAVADESVIAVTGERLIVVEGDRTGLDRK